MSKQDAIFHAKLGYSVNHPNGAWIEEKLEIISYTPPRKEIRKLSFNGDCSPKDGWQAEWLGER